MADRASEQEGPSTQGTDPSGPATPADRRAHNRSLLRRYVVDVLGEGDLDAVEEIFHPEVELLARPDEHTISGHEEVEEYLRGIRDRFADLETEVDDLVASETTALAKFTVTAVHRKDYFGVDASNREVTFGVMSRAEFQNGRMIDQGDIVNPLRMQPPSRRYGRSELLDQIQEGVVVVDRDDRVVQTNPAAERLLGAGDVLNDPLGDLFDGVTIPEAGSTAEVEVDDAGRILDLSVAELTGPGDDRIGRILTFRDATDRVRRRQQLETLNRQNERLGRFVSVVSHDLRNPLEKAAGCLELARETGEPEYFEKVEQSHERVETIVDELLEMARAGVTVEETEQVSLSRLIDDAWATARTDDATLETDLPAGACVETDPDLLQHVLENLFRNASDHNDGPVTITVGTLSEPPGFYVEDDGDGIPAGDREAVFDHGYSTDDDGTGFGLSIVEQFVAAHGWTVAATGADGGGARFEIATGTPLGEVHR